MKKMTFVTAIATGLAAAAISLAGPALAAGANPLVPVGPNPVIPANLGFYNPNVANDAGTVNPAGGLDLAS